MGERIILSGMNEGLRQGSKGMLDAFLKDPIKNSIEKRMDRIKRAIYIISGREEEE